MGKIVIVILILISAASILVPLFIGIWFLIKSAYRYKYVAPKQKKMFNQLVKGDYIWRVDEEKVRYFTVERVEYDFDYKKQINKIKIYYGDSFHDCVEMKPDAAKSFIFCNWYTIKAAADLEYRKEESKRNEAILGVTSSTPEDIKKASEKLIKQLDKIINND